MGLFDKIKDNAKNISMRALEATREYDEDYTAQQQSAGNTVMPTNPATADDQASNTPTQIIEETLSPTPQPEEAVAPPDEDLEFLIGEAEETKTESTPEKPKTAKPDPVSEETEAKPVRKSKVTEITKEEHEKTEKEKRQEKAKQAAKERLAKSYTPSYKSTKPSEKIEVTSGEDSAPEAARSIPRPVSRPNPVGIIDITPKKLQDPLKGAIYARERAALSALASQRKLNGTVALYTATHMNFKTRVFINRIEYSGSFGKTILPIEHIAWVKVRYGGTGVILETTEGKRVVMVVKQADRLPFVDAIMKIQAMQPKRAKFKDTQTIRIDKLEQFGEGIDEIEKLAKLYDKGILSHDEFEAKKKQILGL